MERKELIGVRESRTESSPSARRWDHPGGKLVEEGSHSLKQAELLAILIGSGIAGRPAMAIANAILDEYIGLYGICRNGTLDGLARIPGVGPKKSARILAAIEMGRRLHRHLNSNPRPPEKNASLFGNLNPIAVPNLQAEQPNDIRLVATIIGPGVVGKSANAIAKELISKYGSIFGLFGRDMGDFLEIKGLNSVKIIRIAAALEVAKRIDRALA